MVQHTVGIQLGLRMWFRYMYIICDTVGTQAGAQDKVQIPSYISVKDTVEIEARAQGHCWNILDEVQILSYISVLDTVGTQAWAQEEVPISPYIPVQDTVGIFWMRFRYPLYRNRTLLGHKLGLRMRFRYHVIYRYMTLLENSG
ncbi:hypothetical protein PoB_005668000 [Plakobranchus ocellatus]|uniref:Uncharacterized protein n=1 Tax=Plakobranchus ocellatus TaxID=259542 RepID=A0AAV4CBQ5_9GAST|nr:hypothetical protein PoB_005668000 [Plakobranchus ocellatus]